MPSNQVMKSYTALAVSGGIIENVLNAVQSAKSTAVSKGETQVIDVYFRGHRHDMVWGKILVIPAAVCEGDFTAIPRPLVEGRAFKTFHGDDLADFETFRLAENEFDTPSKEQIKAFKEAMFPKSDNGRFAPVMVFLPAWSNPSDYSIVQWTNDEEVLRQQLCSLCFHVYYNPAFSNLYDELITLEDNIDLVHLHDQMGLSAAFPVSEDAYPDLKKSASVKRPKMLITAANMNQVMEELNPNEPVLDQGEVDVFDEVGKQVAASKKLALTMFTPGQVLQEFYPELNEGLLKYPAQNNSGMPCPHTDTSMDAGPGSASLNPKPSFVQESVPLRQEMQLRGPGAMDEFYRSVTNIPAFRLQMAASKEKTAAATPEARKAVLEILQGVCGEIAATFIAAYRATSKPLAIGIPGDGAIDLSGYGGMELATQMKSLIRTMNDTDLQMVLNDSWAQASVWCNGKERGFTYEVLVRAEAFDDETLELKYRFVTNLK